jgi:hypothetical protein
MNLRICVQVSLLPWLLCAATAWCQSVKEPGRPRFAPGLIDDLPREFKDRAKRISASELPATLDAMLATALRSNPDIRLAEIEVQKAEAQLNQARLKMAQEITSRYRQREVLVELASAYKALVNQGPRHDERYKMLETTQAIAKIESELRYLVGLGAESKPPSASPPGGAAAISPRQSEILTKLRDKLETVVDIRFQGTAFGAVAEYFQKVTEIDFVLGTSLHSRHVILLQLDRIPLRDAMLALADVEALSFVVRDYGILITTAKEASTMNAVNALEAVAPSGNAALVLPLLGPSKPIDPLRPAEQRQPPKP